ncbi:MAG: RrF2 family transcriptional regulator [Anaerolineae bacterium]|nr:RrF2 family transcriptional regulator [Anaerolineae bacterium]
MKITTSGRYAIRAMVDLAIHDQNGPVSRNDIAERQEISGDYIAQLFRRLGQHGLIKSVMGPGGGYLLGKAAREITLKEILVAVEGPLGLVACVLPGGEMVCKRSASCVTRRVWIKLTASLEGFLASITLQDLAEQAKQEVAHLGGACSPVLEAFTDSLGGSCSNQMS